MGGSIGFGDGDTWVPYTNAVREKHVKLVQQFTSSLPATLSEKVKHEKILKYLAENGLRQLGRPPIGILAERQRPEPIHCEMNGHLIYIEYIRRGKFDYFVNILGAPVVKCTSPNTAAEQEVAWSTDDLPPFKQCTGNQPQWLEMIHHTKWKPDYVKKEARLDMVYKVKRKPKMHLLLRKQTQSQRLCKLIYINFKK